ncbi:MAG TPA: BrnT family toxin [Kofleriaceae bacterium]|nr:BrnT family toxin [Kofleriaceae bacterium]
MPTVVEGDFEWDSDKATSNLAKHGVSFADASTVFADPFAIYLDDGSGIGRMVVIGASLRDRLLYVVPRRARGARSHHQRAARNRSRKGRL